MFVATGKGFKVFDIYSSDGGMFINGLVLILHYKGTHSVNNCFILHYEWTHSAL